MPEVFSDKHFFIIYVGLNEYEKLLEGLKKTRMEYDFLIFISVYLY